MSVKVHELAKELKVTSKELIERLKTLRIDVKSHMSLLTEENVRKVREACAPKKAPPSQPSSIESVRKEFLLQRGAAKTAPEVRRTRVESHPAVSAVRRTVVTSTPPKPKLATPEIKKPLFRLDAEKATAVPVSAPVPEVKIARKLELAAPIAVKDLALKLSLSPSDLIQRLIKNGIFANINQALGFDIASRVAKDMGFDVERSAATETVAVEVGVAVKDQSKQLPRAPIVTFMGHVDHGKTSLLDAIRKTKVAAGEAGGITQHIGAYEVFLPKGAVTFLDTPGHEAFTAMRARGARATDVVVLVVAADDGVMPQTLEAIDHAKAAGVTIIVAINKMDLPSANPDRVKKSLMEHGLMSEDWGGKTIMTGVSAKTGQGIDALLEMLALESDLLELKADATADARGVVIEGELSKEKGVIATLLVQDGTLRVGDIAIVGNSYCRVRAMINDRGQRIKEALPSMPVAILGLSEVPKAGDHFYIVKDERKAKEIVEQKQATLNAKGAEHITLEHLYEDIKAGKVEELKLIVKSDVQGSVEALRSTLGKIQPKNVRLNIIHTGIGDVSESDVMLAAASNAVVIGFHVGITGTAKEAAEVEGVDVRFYEIIYEVNTAIEKAMEGLLQPELKEMFVGTAEVRQVFKVSKVGTIAGCTVQKGKIVRNFSCRVVRNGQKIHDGKIESLKRFKDDAREVLEGFECGIGVSNFEELTAGDRIEVFEVQKLARKLE